MNTKSEEERFPDEECKNASAKALKLLLHQDRTKAGLADKLKNAGFSQKATEFAIEYASGYGYLDDKRYAQKYVEYKKTTKSRMEIIYKLREKGVSEYDMEEALESYTSEDEYAALKVRLAKRLKSEDIANIGFEERSKHIRYLTGCGFPMALAKRAFNE
ncbi:MAG: recombination regulator RecX [Eubacterium sp.]|nr:recombination regulator RecX [Eubacterium sp.]